MSFKIPKNSEKYYWTKHSLMKMRQYGLSAQRIARVIRSPKRKEVGIVKNTVAVMQPVSSRRDEKGESVWKSEIWAMYKVSNQKIKFSGENVISNIGNFKFSSNQIKIISAWKYPGISPKNKPIPQEILDSLSEVE